MFLVSLTKKYRKKISSVIEVMDGGELEGGSSSSYFTIFLLFKELEEKLMKIIEGDDDEDRGFLLSLLPLLKRMPVNVRDRAKVAIHQLMIDFANPEPTPPQRPNIVHEGQNTYYSW